MEIRVHFFSYFKDLAGTAQTTEKLAEATTVGGMLAKLFVKFPQLAPMDKSMLVAVGVEYAGRDQVLRDGDEVSLFPPVQGG